MPDDGRILLHAAGHVREACTATPLASWSPSDYRSTVSNGLPAITLFGQPWITAERLCQPPDAEHP